MPAPELHRAPFIPAGPAPDALLQWQARAAALERELAANRATLASAQQELQQLTSILNHVPAMVGYWDTGLINRFANQAYVDWLGKRPGEIAGRHIREVLGEALYALNLPYMEKALAGQAQRFERVIPNPVSGLQRTSQADYIPLVQDGVVCGFFVLVADISQRKQAEAELLRLNDALQTSQALLRDMAARNESRIEGERKHFARELHDELGQLLTALRMDLLFLELKYCGLDDGLRDKIMEMKAMLDQAFAAARNVAAILRPAVLDMGLDAALRWLCSEFQRKRGMPCNYRSEPPAGAIDEQTSMVLFRIVQESLTNIGRHAGPAYADVHLLHRAGKLQVRVRDDGRGFVRDAQTEGKRYGLLGMQERALALGGQLDIRSAPGQGTSVSVSIPWPPAAQESA